MARGWESKSVEAQQEEASRRRPASRPLSVDERRRREERRTLELARARTMDELARANADAHREMLRAALETIDAKLSEF